MGWKSKPMKHSVSQSPCKQLELKAVGDLVERGRPQASELERPRRQTAGVYSHQLPSIRDGGAARPGM